MSENFKKEYVLKYNNLGSDRFYRFLLSSAITNLVSIDTVKSLDKTPDKELLELYEKFLVYYRRDNLEEYFEIAKLCRRAAHKIHRALLKQHLVERNGKFLSRIE